MLRTKPNDLVRTRHVIQSEQDNRVLLDGKSLIQFCHNDYLNLSIHPNVIKAFQHSASLHGVGSRSSALITGHTPPHQALEQAFQKTLNVERALIFNSGYHANLGVMTTFANRESLIVADKHCHASLIDGILLSRAKYQRYHHQNIQHAEKLLLADAKNKLLVTESIFSMSGEITDINAFAKLATKQNANLIVDDAHGFGITNTHSFVHQPGILCTVIPFGKALGGMGAAVVGKHEVIESLLQNARTYCYSTAIPPAVCAAMIETLRLTQTENWRQDRLKLLCEFFTQQAAARQLTLVSAHPTPIKCVLIGDNQKAVSLQKKLIEAGFYVSAIRPPTVPVNTARLRISLNCSHTESQITSLLDAIKYYA